MLISCSGNRARWIMSYQYKPVRTELSHFSPAFIWSFVNPNDSVTTTRSCFLNLGFSSTAPSVTSIFSSATAWCDEMRWVWQGAVSGGVLWSDMMLCEVFCQDMHCTYVILRAWLSSIISYHIISYLVSSYLLLLQVTWRISFCYFLHQFGWLHEQTPAQVGENRSGLWCDERWD